MIGEVIANTNVIRYLMAAMGILGVIAKLVNQVTLNRLIRAAGTMSKSTHRLIKLVKAKYEHACMVHDTVENTDAFVEKYIYEYRGFLFKIHTWRQIEILTVWFSGILALLGASADYLYYGAVESVYQYIAVGAAEMILLEVIRRMSDEPYKIHGVKMYMIDYLDNNFLKTTIQSMKAHSLRLRWLAEFSNDTQEATVLAATKDHLDIVHAMENRDADQVFLLVKKHVANSEKRLSEAEYGEE